MSKTLGVYLHNHLVGQLIQQLSGQLSFQYDAAYSADESNIAISICMPLRTEAYTTGQVQAYFSGLLPDENQRHNLARYLGISEKNPFALLTAVGGECAGALALYPTDTQPAPPQADDIQTLTATQAYKILSLLQRRPLLAGEDGMRLSLAGAQDKLALRYIKGTLALSKGNSPTTHILKPAIASVPDSVHNEYFCMQLAQRIGIDVPMTYIHSIKDSPCFIVERYDRVHEKNNITRLHQEDFCQALGLSPEIKYEREGGPGIADCQAMLFKYSAQPAKDQLLLIKRIIFNYLIGNADAHAKNFSLLYHNKRPQLAPAYDLLSTAIYPEVSTKMAMKIGSQYEPNRVLLRHWQRLVPDITAAKKNLQQQLQKLSQDTINKAHALNDELAQSDIQSPVFSKLCKLISQRAARIQRQLV